MKAIYLFIYTTIMLFSTVLSAQTSPYTMVKKMGRGINLGNVLQAPIEGNWSPAVEEQYFIDVANAGFTNVRIGMDFYGVRTTGDTSIYSKEIGTAASYTGTASDYVVSSTYLNRITTVINWALDQGLVVVLDFHGADLKHEFLYTFADDQSEYTHPTSAKRAADNEKFRTIWSQIANHFKNSDDNLLFEIVNEPYFEVSKEEMDVINEAIVEIIRSTGGDNLTRNIVLTAGTKTSYETPTNIDPELLASDDYLIATFHYYKPFSFTSSSKNGKDDNNWGTAEDKATLAAHFETVTVWSDTYNTPIYLGEFGADNTDGYNYATGDLQEISGNTTGFADGGPDNNSRVAFHGYCAEQAINRGFAFAVWDSGPESNKTVHLRNDGNGVVNYDKDYFSVSSYNPKTTTKSTVVSTATWVEDVKNTLLSSGAWPACDPEFEDELIVNGSYECTSYDANWFLNVVSGAVAVFSNGGEANAKSGESAAKVEVTTSVGYNKVLLQNDVYLGDLNGKTVTVKCHAKSADASAFKFQIKIIGSEGTLYKTSPALSLATNYGDVYSYSFDIDSETTSIQVKALCGNEVGTYYFDDFLTEIVPTEELSTSEYTLLDEVIFYPNPTDGFVFIKGIEHIQRIELFQLTGKKIQDCSLLKDNSIDISHLEKGVYLMKVEFNSGKKKFQYISKV